VLIPYENRATDYYCRDDDNKRNGLKCSPHLHIHIEFFYLLEGRTRAFVDSEEYVVEAGDLLVVFPNRVHRFEEIERERYLLFIVHPDQMPELSHVFVKQTPTSACIRHADEHPILLSLMRALAQTIRTPSPWQEISIRGLFLALFGHMLPLLDLTEPRGEDSHAIREIVNYCTAHFQSDLSLETLEEALHLNRYYISHLFSHKLSIRFNDYVNSLRVSDACRLLRQTDLSITEIGSRSGFNTLRTFNRSFMKQMGLSPSEYRRAYAPAFLNKTMKESETE
jgi:AraC-like DNA-binding protein/mannose-6-phosphate isomerase-like protein (cupin superfamily)